MTVFDLIEAGLALVLIVAVIALLMLAFTGARQSGAPRRRHRPRDP